MESEKRDRATSGSIMGTVLAHDASFRTLDKYDAPGLLGQGERRFHVIAKPIGAACNLNCCYCFYLGKASLPGAPAPGRMSDGILEDFIRQYIEGVTGEEVVFSWQGGEPTLLGLDFFRKVIALEKRFARPGLTIENDLQTNGVLLDEEWCRFLKEHRFLVGLSIDGPRELHDLCRVMKDGAPTFDRVMASARLLKKHDVAFNTLTCVNRYNARRPLDVYRFLRRELGVVRIQFIPIIEYKGFELNAPQSCDPAMLPCDGGPRVRPGHPDSVVTDWSVDPEDWGYFLCKIFDEWLNRDIGKIFVNQIETLVAQHMGLPSQICVYSEFCGKCVAIENNGNVYSCDHYVYPGHCLGNIRESRLGDMVFSRQQVKFGYNKQESLPSQCNRCPYLRDCWGECPKNRIIRTASGEAGLNYLCRGFKKYFAHAIPEVDMIAKSLKERQAVHRPH